MAVNALPRLACGIEKLKGGILAGWITGAEATAPVTVEIVVDGKVVGEARADRVRTDAAGAGLPGGFKLRLPDKLGDGAKHSLMVRAGEQDLLPAAMSFAFDAPQAPTPSPAPKPTAKAKAPAQSAPAPAAPPAPKSKPPKVAAPPAAWTSETAELVDRAFSGQRSKGLDAELAVAARSPIAAVRKLSADRLAAARSESSGAAVALWIDVTDAAQGYVETTLASWALQAQSPPVLFAAHGEPSFPGLKLPVIPQATLVPPSSGFVVFARAGDTFHPELSALLAATPKDVGGVTWDIALQTPGRLISEKALRRHRTFGAAFAASRDSVVGFAVNARALSASGFDTASLPRRAAAHADGAWLYASEILSSTLAASDGGAHGSPALAADDLGGATGLRLLRDGPRQVFAPAGAAGSVALVVALGPDVDAARVLTAMQRQSLTDLQIVLVASEGAPITAPGAKTIAAPAGATLPERYNLGAAATEAETLVFAQNLTGFDDPAAIEGLAAWARLAGVGAVTCAPGVVAIGRAAWTGVGPFDPQGLPTLFNAAWFRRAERQGLQTLALDGFAANASAAARPPPTEERLLEALYPSATAKEISAAPISDARAEFLTQKLMAARRESMRLRQGLADEIGGLSGHVFDLETSLSNLSLKLDRG